MPLSSDPTTDQPKRRTDVCNVSAQRPLLGISRWLYSFETTLRASATKGAIRLLALSPNDQALLPCPLPRVMWTSAYTRPMSANDPKQSFWTSRLNLKNWMVLPPRLGSFQ
jgi:hypothetical protein